ncbi:MAG: DNA-3-methyladenine glycosylase 2 family protein [Pseudomonadales bacterium]|nr:DNA-3-methyladenine glycosylase 2 family protein [Pseudomonadales bacterium]
MTDESPLSFLSSLDTDWHDLVSQVGICRLALRTELTPYEFLLDAIAHQHVHGRAAASLLRRLQEHFQGMPTPEELQACPAETLRLCGFSAHKSAALRDVAQHVLMGKIPDKAQARDMTDRALIDQLTQIRGIGRWTVEMLLMFNLARPDILPVGDFGVREGYRKLKRLSMQPKPAELTRLGLAWSPYRSTASWYLWQATQILPNPEAPS